MKMPLSAMIGIFMTGTFLFIAIFAQWIAPYPIDSAVGKVWEGPSAEGPKPKAQSRPKQQEFHP